MISTDALIDILVKSGADIERNVIKPHESFEDMGLDSLDMFNFFTQIDDELDIEVPDDVFEKMLSLEDVRDYLASEMSG